MAGFVKDIERSESEQLQVVVGPNLDRVYLNGVEKRIFILNGKAGAGKDTFALYLNVLTPTLHYSSVRKVKEIARSCGWDDNNKTEKDRKFLSELKQLTTEYSDLSFKDVGERVREFLYRDIYKNIMLIDIREPEEIKRFVDCYPRTKTIYIENINIDKIESNNSDKRVENFQYDYIVKNNGTFDELEQEVKKFYNKVLEEGELI